MSSFAPVNVALLAPRAGVFHGGNPHRLKHIQIDVVSDTCVSLLILSSYRCGPENCMDSFRFFAAQLDHLGKFRFFLGASDLARSFFRDSVIQGFGGYLELVVVYPLVILGP